MAKRATKKVNSNELDGKEFFAAIAQIEKEKGIPKSYMVEKITQALITAYKRDHEGAGDNITVDANEERGEVRMFVKKPFEGLEPALGDELLRAAVEELRPALFRDGKWFVDYVRIRMKARKTAG